MKTKLLLLSALCAIAATACSAGDGEPGESGGAATSDDQLVTRNDVVMLVQLEPDSVVRIVNPNGTVTTADAQVQRFQAIARGTGRPLALVASSALPAGKTFDVALDQAMAAVEDELRASEGGAKDGSGSTAHVTLAIAGHSNGMTFWQGGGATLSFDGLAHLAARHPTFASHVTRLLLLGCNAGRQYWTDQWRAPFPNLVGAAGFNNTAPTATNGGNMFVSGFLYSLPTTRPSAGAATATLNRLVAQGFSAGAFEVIDGSGTMHYASNVPPTRSNDAWDRLHELQPKYDCYFYARPGCESPPADSVGNAVHDYYIAAQDYVTALGQEGAPPASFAGLVTVVGQSLRLRRFESDKRAYLEDPKNHARFTHLFPANGLTLDQLADPSTSRRTTLDVLGALPKADADAQLLVRALSNLDPTALPDNTVD